MNKGLFRLIFSTHLGMFVAASELALSRAGRSSGSSARRRRRALAASLMAAITSYGALALADAPAGLQPGTKATAGTGSWTGANIANSSANQMTIQQTQAKAILNWQQLNLSKGETLNFNQQGNRSWAALNRIHDIDPSRIAGNVNADGHIYFINTNGIIFGNGAQINVGSLTASSLNFTDDALFNKGILSDPTKAVFSGTGGFVTVEQGAALTAATGGRVMLLAKNVTNNGVISTPDGQTILAAGEKVYLAKSDDPAGLLVEVDAGGTAKNLGEIIAQRGNVTLVGLAVNQEGRISASTSVRANGSIYLQARDKVQDPGTAKMTAQRGGVVTLGKNSSTTIDVEVDDKEEVLDKQVLNPSRVKISGGVIDIEGSIIAHGGEVTATAAFNPGDPDKSKENGQTYAVDATRIYLGKDALIDVSGTDASAPMSRNQLEIQLFSDQLKDAPLQRGGPLFGKVIYVDARKDTGLKDSAGDDIKGTALTDIQPYLNLKGKTIAEHLSAGGTVNLSASKGDVVLRAGSELNVSGGSVTYEAGYLRESTLSYQGKTVAISRADPNTPYQKLADTYSVTDSKWGVTRTWALNSGSQATLGTQGVYNAAYSAGSDAGTVKVTAANAVLQADMKATTSPGITQRKQTPNGGTFNLSMLSGGVAGLLPTIRVVEKNNGVLPGNFTVIGELDKTTAKFAAGDVLTDALKSEIQLDTKLFDQGFNHVKLKSDNANIIVDAAIKTAPAGSIEIATPSKTSINANITLPGGTVSINPSTTTAGGDVLTPSGDVAIADGVIISTAGLFTNDTPGLADALTAPVVLDGGNVVINGIRGSENSLTLGSGALIDASAGAWLNASGKFAGGKGGKGGNITLNGVGASPQGQVQSYGFSKGGELSLTTMANAQIGGQNPAAADTLWLPELFFGQGGFSKYSVTTSAAGADLMIGDAHSSATVIHPTMQTLVARGGVASRASGAATADVASPALPAPSARVPVSLAFKSTGALTVAKNALIKTDAPNSGNGGVIDLQSIGQMTILGSLIAPAGKISATITGGITSLPFDNTLSLFVGESARLLAAGYYAVPPSNDGNRVNAKVLNGGDITLDGGDRGVVITKQGSLLDVSGVSGQVDIAASNGYTRQTLYGSAGDINISSRNALVLDGDLTGNATGTGAGGTLNLDITGSTSNASSFVHPNDARTLTVTPKKINRAENLNAGNVLDSVIGQGAISAEQITAGGFDRLSLVVGLGVSGDKIVLSSGLDLKLPTALTLDAALLEVTGSGTALLTAPHTTLTNFKSTAAPAPITGNATLEVKADFIDLMNPVAISGVSSSQFSALQDIRGRNGSLVVPGVLELKARQIYPATASKFGFEAIGAGSKIWVQPSGDAPVPVLSAGGELTLKADVIQQDGALRAPLGQITLDAAKELTLAAGSLTSVSTGGLLIPYGLTGLGGLNWVAPNGDLDVSGATDAVLEKLPEKKINLKSADVKLQTGATVDISGGGDVLAYEFIKGIGGSKDILGQKGVYAVMPTMRDEYAPFDYSYNKIINPDITKNPEGSTTITINTDLKPGDAVYLSAVPGLAAGTYTLLPGRYALLPGAFMVQTGKTQLRQGQSVAQLDGSTLVSGYRTTLADTTTNRDSQWDVFKVTDGSIFHPTLGTISKAPAEYRLTTGNQFFKQLALDAGLNVPRLASDAGQLTLNAGTDLTLGASILTTKDSGARGALVDITSGKISVVSAIGADDGTLQLTADSLNALHAESLLLGGARTQDTDGNGMTIATNANTVTFANDADHALEVTELIAAAKETLTVNGGAEIGTLATTQPAGITKLRVQGDGALLAVSALNELVLDRTGTTATPTRGTLDIQDKSTIHAHRSLALDSTKANHLVGSVTVNKGGSATLGANRILLGAPGDTVVGTRIDQTLLSSFGDLAKVTLNSSKNVDIYGPVSVGNKELDLVINAAGIAGHMTENKSATVTANNFVLKNSAGATDVAGVGASGSKIDIKAQNILFEGRNAADTNTNAGKTVISGFENVNLEAQGDIAFSGTGDTQLQATTSTLTSAGITAAKLNGATLVAASGADYALKSSGKIITKMISDQVYLPSVNSLGAKLKVEATGLELGGAVDLASGQFTAIATEDDLVVTGNAKINVASTPVEFDKYTKHTPAGSVSLQADAGNVTVNEGAEIDVSGIDEAGTGDAPAGTIKITAQNGTTTIAAGTLKGQAAAGRQGGSFILDSKFVSDSDNSGFSNLNTTLNQGGFNYARDMRIRNGDVTIAQAIDNNGDAVDAVIAKNMVLSTDAGAINVVGKINASGETAGSIALYGGTGVTLDETAKLDASAKAAGEHGGKVEIATLTGSIDIKKDSTINVSGGANGAGGKVYLRAPRNTDNTDINITSVAGTVTGASTIRAEGFKAYNDTSLTSSDFAKTSAWYADAEAFLKSVLVKDDNALVKVGLQRLGKLNDPVFTIVPGIEIRNTEGDLTLANEWSLHDWRFDPATGAGVTDASQLGSGLNAPINPADTAKPLLAGVLTLRAKGNLKMDNALSDGFSAAKTTAVAQGIQAWSYNLVAGADDTAANPLSTVKGASSVTIGPTVGSVTASAIVKEKVATISATVSGYTLAAAPIVAFTIDKIPAGDVTLTKLKIGTTIVKDLVNSDGTALTTDGIVSGTTYFAKYNSTTDKYQLFPNLVRTGAGDIRIASGGDVKLAANSSVIYSAGHKSVDPSGYASTSTTHANAFYGTGGGNVEIKAQGNITGVLGTGNIQQLVNNWLFREGGGTENRDLSWWVRPDLFRAGVATLGGGDVTVQADGNITNLSASAATTARYDSNGETGNFKVDGGGDLHIQAGGDIANGVYYAGRGKVVLNAGGEVRKLPGTTSTNGTFGTVLALQDASAEVHAVKSAFIETVFNPTAFSQSNFNSGKPQSLDGSSLFFLSYGTDSAFRLDSLLGDATLGLAATNNITNRIGQKTGTNNITDGFSSSGVSASASELEIHPATVEAIAYSGNIQVGRLVLAPAAKGNLSLLAAGDVSEVANGLIAVSDADAQLIPSIASPQNSTGTGTNIYSTRLKNIRTSHAATPVHRGDDQPLVIVARDGSITLEGSGAGSAAGPGLFSPKAAYLHAGKDITVDADIQHVASNDFTVIEAGRDFVMPLDTDSIVQLAGPGELLVQAGRNVSLGSSKGIVSVANTQNPALPDDGVAITVLAGLGKEGANLGDYIAAYINPIGSGPAVLHGDGSKLAAYRQQTAQAVTAYMRKLSGNDGLSDNDAMTQYLALDEDRKAVFAYRHFSSELLASGKGFAGSKNHNRGDNAIAMLFPSERKYDGDLALFNSQLRTKRGGSIDMLTPGGFVNAGVPTSSGDDIGIVTERDGDIRAFAETGFQVEQSRVITQFGSDITVWVNNGDIDAGRGSKTAVSVPERVVSTDKDGNTTIEVKGAATGSGIRAQTYDPDGPAGNKQAPGLGSVALIAPRGILNAGEAGIAAGNFLAVATQVLGGGNIQVSGSSTGVPLADTGSLAGSLAAVPSGVSDATKTAAEDMARQFAQASTADSFVPSFISVEVIGLGDDEQGTGEKDKNKAVQ